MRLVTSMAVAATMVVSAPAYAASYVTDTSTFVAIGDQIGSTFDQVTLGGVSGTISSPGPYLINNVSFLVGLNATVPAASTGTFTNTITIGGTPFSYSVPYTININTFDTITFNSFTTTLDGFRFAFNPLTLSSDGSSLATGMLSANVSAVPEPATWAMMIIGFGAIGGAMRRRNAVRTRVSYG